MRRLRDDQDSLWEAVIPREWTLQGEWAVLDTVLDDDRFLEPFAQRLESQIGRPTIPMERYLRMMVVKHRYGWGYEVLVREVADPISLRHFCRIPLGAPVPHSTTLIKLTRRFGPEVLEELNHWSTDANRLPQTQSVASARVRRAPITKELQVRGRPGPRGRGPRLAGPRRRTVTTCFRWCPVAVQKVSRMSLLRALPVRQ